MARQAQTSDTATIESTATAKRTRRGKQANVSAEAREMLKSITKNQLAEAYIASYLDHNTDLIPDGIEPDAAALLPLMPQKRLSMSAVDKKRAKLAALLERASKLQLELEAE